MRGAESMSSKSADTAPDTARKDALFAAMHTAVSVHKRLAFRSSVLALKFTQRLRRSVDVNKSWPNVNRSLSPETIIDTQRGSSSGIPAWQDANLLHILRTDEGWDLEHTPREVDAQWDISDIELVAQSIPKRPPLLVHHV